jgi:hypothetical protein
MSTLDEITKEKQRISDALARVDEQREKLTGQLAELDATERVLARYSKGTRGTRTTSARTSTTTMKAADPARPSRRLRSTAAKRAPTLGDQVLALATGKTQQEIAAACKGARPNHVGVDRVLGRDRPANLCAGHRPAQRRTDQRAANRRPGCERYCELKRSECCRRRQLSTLFPDPGDRYFDRS